MLCSESKTLSEHNIWEVFHSLYSRKLFRFAAAPSRGSPEGHFSACKEILYLFPVLPFLFSLSHLSSHPFCLSLCLRKAICRSSHIRLWDMRCWSDMSSLMVQCKLQHSVQCANIASGFCYMLYFTVLIEWLIRWHRAVWELWTGLGSRQELHEL